MKRFTLFLICLFSVVMAHASDDSKWNTLYSYHGNITMLQKVGTLIYGVSSGYLFRFDTTDSTFETYGKIYNSQVVSICSVDSLGCLAIGYDDSNIQLLYPNGTYTNIPGIKNTQWNLDKTINEMSASGERLYVSTNFGLVIIDAKNAVIKESCILNIEVHSASENGSDVYLATNEGVLKGNRSDNLQDKSNWNSFPVSAKYTGGTTFSDAGITKIVLYKGLTHFLVTGSLICNLKTDGTVEKVLDWGPTAMLVSAGRLVAYKENTIYNFTDLNTFTYAYTSLGAISSVVPEDDNTFWIGCDDKGLSEVKTVSGNEYSSILRQGLFVNSPLSNYPFSMKYENDKLLVLGGGCYKDRYNYDAAFSTYDTETKVWKNSDLTQIKQIDSYGKDFVSIAVDPSSDNHYFISTWGEGICEFDSTKCVNLYNTTNSTLQDIFSGEHYIRSAGLTFDSDNNLWMTNTMVDNTVTMMTQNGTWKKYSFSQLKPNNSTSHFLIDSYGNKWIGSSVASGQATFIVWKDNGTYDDTSDDSYLYQNSMYDQDNNSLDFQRINQIAEDLDGNIWLATSIGSFKIYNSSTITSKSQVVLNTIKIPRNDGTNYVDILLENMLLNDMIIDGANQKWFATATSGVYVVSADALSTIYHFTTDNSILPSNNILSLAMDKETGLVFIGTDKGIVTYQSSYVSGRRDYSSVYTYPNPVRPEYTGDITIKGLQYGSTVKITDLNGNIINQGISSGGTYIWDGKDVRGARVRTGVYLVFAATEDGGEGVATKIMIVNY